MNLKIPGTIFLLIPFYIINKREYLRILKFLPQFFFFTPSSNV